jgi:hypothetical protein
MPGMRILSQRGAFAKARVLVGTQQLQNLFSLTAEHSKSSVAEYPFSKVVASSGGA